MHGADAHSLAVTYRRPTPGPRRKISSLLSPFLPYLAPGASDFMNAVAEHVGIWESARSVPAAKGRIQSKSRMYGDYGLQERNGRVTRSSGEGAM